MADIQEHDLEKVESIEKITAWLQPTDYGEFRRHLAAQAPGTGLWLRQTREYRQWRDSKDCGTMWLKGVPVGILAAPITYLNHSQDLTTFHIAVVENPLN